MSPRFPQEIFDYIIDYNQHQVKVLKTYSTVCKRWAVRSRSYLFDRLHIRIPADLDLWCQRIPSAIDGPSRYVKVLYIHAGVTPLVCEPRPLDPYLDHFSALTYVAGLILGGYRGSKLRLDVAFQCFSGFKNTLRWLKLTSNSFRFEEISRILEFFPNLETLLLWPPKIRPSDEKEPFQPPGRAVFPRLTRLDFHPISESLLEHHLLTGFAGASMDLESLTVLGPISDPGVVQKLLDSSAKSLTDLRILPLELDLSACDKIQHIVVEDLLHSYLASLYYHDSFAKPQFEHMLSTIQSHTLHTISVPITAHSLMEEDEEIELPRSDWKGVDLLLCDLLVRVRKLSLNPFWTFRIRVTGCVFDDEEDEEDGVPPEAGTFLPGFQEMGGVVVFSTSVY